MIGYINYPLIVRSKASLGSSREVEYDCGVSFVNYFYLLLIVGQNFCITCATLVQTKQGQGLRFGLGKGVSQKRNAGGFF